MMFLFVIYMGAGMGKVHLGIWASKEFLLSKMGWLTNKVIMIGMSGNGSISYVRYGIYGAKGNGCFKLLHSDSVFLYRLPT